MICSMNDLVTKAQQELASIRKQLTDMDFRRRELESRANKLHMLLKVTEDLGYLQATNPSKAPEAGPLPLPPLPPLPKLSASLTVVTEGKTQKEKITDFCAELLAVGFPMKTSELLQELQQAGIEVGGANKLLTVSALLSKDDRFVPSRKEGWSLKR